MINENKFLLGTILVPLLFFSSSCQPKSDNISPPQINTDFAVGALYFSPQQEPGQPIRGKGSVVLFDQSGNVTHHQLDEVERGNLAWNNQGTLFYSDSKNDYFINNNQIKAISNIKKSSYNDSLFPVNHDEFIGIYNQSFGNNSYIEPVIIHSKDGTDQKTFNHSIWSSTKCGDNIYSLKMLEAESEERAEHADHALNSIYFNGALDFSTEIYHSNHLPSLAFPSGNIPCQNNKVYTPTSQFSDNRLSEEEIRRITSQPDFHFPDKIDQTIFFSHSNENETTLSSLDIWDVNTETVTSIPLTSATSDPLHLSVDDIVYSIVDDGSLIDNYLYWIKDKSILKTDITTGITHEIITPLHISQKESNTLMDIHNEKMHIAQSSLDHPDRISIIRINLENGEKELDINLKLDDMGLSDHKPTGFAVNPSHN